MPSLEQDDVILELEALRSRLDDSLEALAGREEHVPMHDVVGGLLRRLQEQHTEIQDLRRQLADCLGWRNQQSHAS